MRAGWIRAGLWAALLPACFAAAADERPRRGSPGCDRVSSSDQFVSVESGGELRLATGGVVRLLDVRLAGGAAGERARAWLATLAREPVAVRAVGRPDRWDRVAADVALAGQGGLDLAELLVGEGFAFVDPGSRDALCRNDLLAVEAGARRRRVGLWSDATWPVAADDAERLGRAAGQFVIVEGRILSVGERRDRTYLDFGRDWSRDFTVVVPRRSWSAFAARGLSGAELRGRRVRVRGVLEVRRGPTMEITSPDVVEVLDGETRRR